MKLWYAVKKHLGNARIVNSCDRCKSSLVTFSNRDLTETDVILIVPDKFVTGAYHIGRASLKNIKGTEIYKQLYGEE